ncbi:MAG: exopolysaccharide Pel transporter PelG [bacterium]
MAGIGFELEKILDRGTLSSSVQGFFYSAIVNCGPWIFTIIALSLLGSSIDTFLSVAQTAVFRGTVIYVFCFSLITTSPITMVVTRHISDLIYEKNEHKIMGVFISSSILIFIVQSLSSFPFFLLINGSLFYRFNGFACYLLVSYIWHLMIFISAVKKYNSIVISFGIGMLSALVLGNLIGQSYGLSGVLLGMNLGLVEIAFTLTARVCLEFNEALEFDLTFLKSFSRYWDLALFGLFYNLGIWVDKIVFWYSPTGEKINNLLYYHYPYDSAMFLAYLTAIPALSFFFIVVETEFYRSYRSFFQNILQKRNLREIRLSHASMKKTLIKSFSTMTQFQLVIALIAIFIAPRFIESFQLNWAQLYIFRVGVLAATLQVFILLGSVIIFYLDFRKDAMIVAVVLFFTNWLFTRWSIAAGFENYGYGYFASTFLTFILTFILVNYRFRKFIYFTFFQSS